MTLQGWLLLKEYCILEFWLENLECETGSCTVCDRCRGYKSHVDNHFWE